MCEDLFWACCQPQMRLSAVWAGSVKGLLKKKEKKICALYGKQVQLTSGIIFTDKKKNKNIDHIISA